ncbi:hypothetical protein C8F04DRAFT_722039 [Mycena alexandri]|uniref:Uncharacterized protein n=1 Tax=Mycena alexandri TaxID=1745969 RepID=A0AAD6TBK9_9AGAR|nr:hypothetical protein C8F04DRAFT_722039 [Mycena alexandri]
MKQALRSRLLTDILQSLISSRSDPQSIAAIEHALTLGLLGCGGTSGIGTSSLALIGGLTEEDIRRFSQSCTPMQNLISEEMNAILRLIANYWDSSSSDSHGTMGTSSRDLLHDIQTRLEKIEALEADGDAASERIMRLLQRIHEIHPRLQQRLTYALERFPTEMESRSAASDDLLAMAIEASLVKVSLVRAQALDSVYNYHSQKNPELHMRRALSAAHMKLKEDEREMEEEERKLDRELAQYQTLLDMVDGGGSGGFRQIVADTARVGKETEECKRDLRRLGWTGED